MWQRGFLFGLLVGSVFIIGCDSPEPEISFSRDAKPETVSMLREDLEAERHPADGGGRGWIVDPAPPVTVRVGSRERFEIVYEAGPLGVAEGGAVYLQTSPFWGWDTPQVEYPESPGYTEVSTDAEGIELRPATVGLQLLAIKVAGRKLEEGERIRIVFGAGPAGARVDRYAEHRSPIWIGVDGDGDGVRSLIPDPPSVDAVAAEPTRLVLSLPSTARPGDKVRLTVSLVDALGNAGFPFEGEVVLARRSEDLELPERLVFEAEHRGARTVEAAVTNAGVFRVLASTTVANASERSLLAESNPMVVREGIPRVLWGDLHGHSQLSDGTGTPEDYYAYARDVAALDVAALTDHDHWGMRFLDKNPEGWDEIREASRRFNEPGRFVALAGYEWTSWVQGHRHVLYFNDEGKILSSMDPRYETPRSLWDALADSNAVSVAHHSAGGPVSTNWDFVPDSGIEPVIEIVSVHGSSEADDSPGPIYDAVDGNFVRDGLAKGLQFGFIGSGDGHDGHPGLAHLGSPNGGLAAIFSEEVSREGVLEALRSRRVYATNGPRIWLRLWLDDNPMGSVLASVSSEIQQLKFAAATTAPVERIDFIRSGEVVETLPGEGARELSDERSIPRLQPGDYIYIRILQEDGGTAWSSPIFMESGVKR